jgi:BlaI family penicillinase repressor
MAGTRLSKLEMRIMETLWEQGEASIRAMQESFPAKKRPGYTTIQKTVYRLEEKKVLRRVKKVGNFHIFAPLITRESAQRRLIDDLLALLGGNSRPVMAHLIDAGKLTLEDVAYAEETLKSMQEEEKK